MYSHFDKGNFTTIYTFATSPSFLSSTKNIDSTLPSQRGEHGVVYLGPHLNPDPSGLTVTLEMCH